MNLISDLDKNDSITFSIRHIACMHSDLTSFANFKIVRRDTIYKIWCLSDDGHLKSTVLTKEQLDKIRAIEKSQKLGSTTYDEYVIKRRNKTTTRARDTEFARTILSFFQT